MDFNKAEQRQYSVRENYEFAESAQVCLTDQIFLYQERVASGKCSSKPHYHSKIDEVIYVLNGELVAYEGEESIVLHAGDSVCFKANSKKNHYLKNESQEEAEFLIF
jgi:uncharacterized cupin superfamily protein